MLFTSYLDAFAGRQMAQTDCGPFFVLLELLTNFYVECLPEVKLLSLFPQQCSKKPPEWQRQTLLPPSLQKVRELPAPDIPGSDPLDWRSLVKNLAVAGVIVGAGLIALAVRHQIRRGVRGKNVGPEAPRFRTHGYEGDGGEKKGARKPTTTVEGIKVAEEDAGVVKRHLAMGEKRPDGPVRCPSSQCAEKELVSGRYRLLSLSIGETERGYIVLLCRIFVRRKQSCPIRTVSNHFWVAQLYPGVMLGSLCRAMFPWRK
jgi:hypothetical protein